MPDMITDYSQKDVQYIIRVHAAMHDDYTKLYRRWELAKNPTQKAAFGRRLTTKEQVLAKLSEEIRQLTSEDSIIEKEDVSIPPADIYEPVAHGISTRNVSFQILIAIISVAALAIIMQQITLHIFQTK